MRAVFISYRRDDSEGQAGRLYDDLARHFGDGSVFMDVAGIDPGLDFRKVIDKHVSSCGVLLCLIGPAWLDAKDENGRRRLDNPLDFVRLETAAALKRDIPVVPVLVAKARMPSAEQLPDDLKELAYRNGVELTHARWDTDVQVLVKALQRQLDNTPPVDRAQDRTIEKTTASVETKGASTLPPDGPTRKSRRTLAMAVVAAIAIAAGVGYVLYENKNASRVEEVKVRQAAADAAARQLAQDEKAAADKETSRKAAADRETAQKAAADREEARKAAADRKAAQKASSERELARKAAADREATQKAAADREATKRAAAQQVASSTPHVTVRSTSCVGLGSGQYAVTVSGDAQVPPAETYGLYAEVHLSRGGLRWRPACGSWGPAQQTDGSLWEVSCIHRPNDSPQTKFDVTWTVSTTDGRPPSDGGMGTHKFDTHKGPFTSFSLNCPSSTQAPQSQSSIPNFAGVWAEINPKDAASPLRLKVEQSGAQISLYISYTQVFSNRADFEAAVSQGRATTSMRQGCGPKFQKPGYNYDNPGVNIFTVSLRGPNLVYEQDTKWTSPCDGHPIGVEKNSRELQRVPR
jgi:TIR domain